MLIVYLAVSVVALWVIRASWVAGSRRPHPDERYPRTLDQLYEEQAKTDPPAEPRVVHHPYSYPPYGRGLDN
jgi:hypothetical protein